jgi:hypothetical protein
MNERIKELAKQANELDYKTFDAYNHKTIKHYKFDKEKFAELIVRECLEQIWYNREDGINGNVSQVIKDRITEHFGVEE